MIIGNARVGKGLRAIELQARTVTGNPHKKLRLLATPSHIPLAEKIADRLGVPLFPVDFTKRPTGLWSARLLGNVRNADVFIVHTANTGLINENTMQLHSMLSALGRQPEHLRPSKVIASTLHYPYARQERKAEPREPISAAVIAHLISSVHYPVVEGAYSNMLISVGGRRVVDRLIVVNLHSAAVEGLFPMPVDHLDARALIVDFIRRLSPDIEKVKIAGPDAGRVKMAFKIAESIFAGEAQDHLFNIAKIRGRKDPEGRSETTSIVVGDVKGCDVFLVDDMIDTAGTIVRGAEAVLKAGAERVFVVTVHGLFSGKAIERLASSRIEKIAIVNTVNMPLTKLEPIKDRLELLPFEDLLGTVIERTFKGQSIFGYQSLT